MTGCGKPSQDECRAAIKRTIDVQLDALNDPLSPSAAFLAEVSAEQRRQTVELLKAHAGDIISPEAVQRCVDRFKKSDIPCTMSASTPDELVKNCHWKVVPGPRGPAIGL